MGYTNSKIRLNLWIQTSLLILCTVQTVSMHFWLDDTQKIASAAFFFLHFN